MRISDWSSDVCSSDLTVFSGREAVIARHLIDQIDETGYLAAPLLDIANRLGAPLAEVAAVLGRIQTFDPTGVGARALAECLAPPAKEAARYDPCMARLIAHLYLVSRGETPGSEERSVGN